jgi:hypothetical protein
VSALKTAAWFIAILVGFELTMLALKRVPKLAESHLLKYFDYGLSAETKLRAQAADPGVHDHSIFEAGWLDVSRFPPEGESCDVSIYGMSFARDLAGVMRDERPDLIFRDYGGPGAPLSHAYTAYKMDAPRRKSRVVQIPLLSEGITFLRSMTHDTAYPDFVQPVTWPRYAVQDGRAVIVQEAAIQSAAAMRSALLGDSELWQRELATLAHDDYFQPLLYATHWTEQFASLRLLRRALGHSHTHELRAQLMGPGGYRPDTETAELERVLLRQYIDEVRAHDEVPIVVMFDSPGEPAWLRAALQPVFDQTKVAVVSSQDYCDASRPENFTSDGHFQHPCLEQIAHAFLEHVDRIRVP